MGKKRVLVFHPAIAPYRIRFFNELNDNFSCEIHLSYRNLKSQTFNYDIIESQFNFQPYYDIKSIQIKERSFFYGFTKIIRDYNPDIVIVSEYGEDLWGALITRAIQRKHFRIISICDDSLKIAEECVGLRRIARDIAVRYIDGLILCNDSVAEWYKTHTKICHYVFPIIQDETDFKKDELLAKELASEHMKQYNLYGKRIFLFVGRLSPEKNIEYLIRSFVKQISQRPENKLFIVGGESRNDVGFKERMESYIHSEGADDIIHFVGRKEGIELKAWYLLGQVFVLPSTYEPFGAVVNEALLSGEYVMVSQNAGSSCLVTPQNGEVVDVSQPMIDFTRASCKVPTLHGDIRIRQSMMPYSFKEKMDGLLKWIDRL